MPQHSGAARGTRAVRPTHGEGVDGVAPIGPPSAAPTQDPEPQLPHERDQSTGETGGGPDAVMEQARRDLESGQVDTDLHATPGLDAQRRRELLRRER